MWRYVVCSRRSDHVSENENDDKLLLKFFEKKNIAQAETRGVSEFPNKCSS